MRQLEEREAQGSGWEGGSCGASVFADAIGRPLTSFHVSRRVNKVLNRAGLPDMRYHDLRHGAASRMPAQGVSARTAMEILGHAQISTTLNIHTHIAPELQKEAVERNAGALCPEIPIGLVSGLAPNPPPTTAITQN